MSPGSWKSQLEDCWAALERSLKYTNTQATERRESFLSRSRNGTGSCARRRAPRRVARRDARRRASRDACRVRPSRGTPGTERNRATATAGYGYYVSGPHDNTRDNTFDLVRPLVLCMTTTLYMKSSRPSVFAGRTTIILVHQRTVLAVYGRHAYNGKRAQRSGLVSRGQLSKYKIHHRRVRAAALQATVPQVTRRRQRVARVLQRCTKCSSSGA